MQFEELRYVCQEAAIEVVRSNDRPIPPTVVLPGPQRTQLVALPDFPEDDEVRHALLAQFAADRMTPEAIPAWGFVAEADVNGADAVITVFGARRHAPHITASRFTEEGGLEAFVPSEELDPTALPFLHPLQHAVDALPAQPPAGPGGPGGPDDVLGSGGLPIHPD
ncbi:hypothetical protein [Egicoccus halophilus]|uniref:Uncharacterized protein n=1 Tax=Egicoccus halophilus TaxID=1670830 RepID=A0A8J3AC63_9ACTN|nr:hypothetical protein [Egicoccus halophilus]GGI08300.1 hypothetical protein GCM10011354_28400 [Egicoccus halophilus]